MKLILAFLVILGVFFYVASALPNPNERENNLLDDVDTLGENEEPQDHGRYKRLTCNTLSGLGVQDPFCAAHCLQYFRTKGYCNSKRLCVCS
uniref:Invertebrate defensins family profile domain-containing protein n=1 Tax=Stomoxys calcitrans TaxID=35570 RepID=A0A2Y9D4R1_STOCA